MAKLDLKPIPGTEAAPEPVAETAAAGPKSVDQIVAGMIESGATIEALTKVYLKVRNSKSDLAEQAKNKTAPLNKALDLIENHFLAKMDEQGVDSFKTKEGTPYKTTKTSITIGDNEQFVGFVLDKCLAPLPIKPEAMAAIKKVILDSGMFGLIEARASKTACEAYLEENKELPAGLNRRSEYAVNVKAS